MFAEFACPVCHVAPEYPPVPPVRPGDVWKMVCRYCGTKSWYDAAGVLLDYQPADAPSRERDLVAVPVEGWRLWKVATPGPGGPSPWMLGSVGLDRHVWDAPVMEARHIDANLQSHRFYGGAVFACESPDLYCHCGFWAFKQLDSLWEHCLRYSLARQELWAFGKVEMWGRLVEHQNGWRAQFVRPVEVELGYYEGAFIRKEDAAESAELTARVLAKFYRCRVRVVPPSDVGAILDGETKRQVMAASSSVPWAPLSASAYNKQMAAFNAQMAQTAHVAALTQAQVQTFAQITNGWASPPPKDPWWMRILYAVLAVALTVGGIVNFQTGGGWSIVLGLFFALVGVANARRAWRGW